MLVGQVLIALFGSRVDWHAVSRALPAHALLAAAAGYSVTTVHPLQQHLAGRVWAYTDVFRLHELLEQEVS
jgi:hypothetical protein